MYILRTQTHVWGVTLHAPPQHARARTHISCIYNLCYPNLSVELYYRLEDGVIPTWQRADYYDDTYPKYREDYGFIEGPQVTRSL